MPVLWPGHRWEDYQVRLIDLNWDPTDTLGTTYKLRGIRSLYGQFKGELTFALEKQDPHAQFLLERQVHFIQVLRDGRCVFEGFQIKLDREDVLKHAERWIEFAFLPLAFLLHWRVGIADAKNDYNGPLDDNFKEIVRLAIGPTAPPTPTSALARIMPDFSVQANAGLAPAIDIDASGQIIYEIIQQFAAAHKVDWDIVFDADFHPQFRTYYPRRGTDRTEGGPGPDSARCIFSDKQGNFVKQSYGQDTSDLKTTIYDRLGTIDVNAGPTRILNWLLREGIIDSGDAAEMLVALRNADLKEWYKLDEFKESLGKQWQQHFFVGDEITWNSVRLGYGPHDDTVAFMEFEIDEAGFEHLTPTFGKPEPDIRDNLRGGGRGRRRPGYTAPTIWHLFGDAATLVDPDADNAIGVIGGVNITVTEGANIVTIDGTGPAGAAFVAPALTFGAANVIGASGDVIHSDSVVALGITCPDANTVYPLPAGPNRWTLTSVGGTITITGAVANQVNFEGVPGATCLWVRADLDSGAGVISGLHTGVAAEPVMIGADQADLTATPWVGTSGGTKLDVRGLVRVVRGLYCNEASLALWGMDAGVPKVHIVDETAAVGGAGGGACLLDIYNAGVRHHMFDANIANPSFIRGFFEVHDAAGLIGHSFNAVTGATIFNEQNLATGDARFESATNTHVLHVDATGAGAVELWNSADFEVYSDAALTIEMSIDGTTGIATWDTGGTVGRDGNDLLIASTTDDLIVRSSDLIRFETNGANVRWFILNDGTLRPDATNTYTFGTNGRRPSTIYGVLGDYSGDVTIAFAAGIVNTGRIANRFVLISDGTRFQGRGLVAADLGGHVHAFAGSSGAGTAHGHTISGNTGAGTAHNHTVTGQTDTFTPPSDPQVFSPAAETHNYFRTATNAAGNDPGWRLAHVRAAGHEHPLTGGVGTAATANEAAHTHPNGTLAADNEVAHTHPVGTYAVGAPA